LLQERCLSKATHQEEELHCGYLRLLKQVP
jgi:hypothetical protein